MSKIEYIKKQGFYPTPLSVKQPFLFTYRFLLDSCIFIPDFQDQYPLVDLTGGKGSCH